MAEEGSEGSVANSSSTTNLWDLHRHHHHHHHPHGSGLSSWNNVISWHPPPNPTSNSSCEEDISISNSFTNTSNHSGLSDDSSRHLMEPGRLGEQDEFVREPTSDSHHLWSQVLLGAGSNGDLNNHQDVGENFLEALSSKNLPSEIFEPACDYLKKTDNGWEFANTPSFNNIERQLNTLNGSFLEPEKQTNLVSNWSIAPPYPDLNRQMIQPSTRNTSLNSLDAEYSNPDLGEMKQHLFGSSPYGVMGNGNSGFMPSYGHGMKNIEASRDASLNRPIRSNNIRYQMGHNNSFMEDNNKYYYGISDAPWTNSRNLSDVIPSNGCLNKPLMDLQASRKPCLKTSSSPEIKKQSHDHVSPPYTRGNSRANGVATEGKKKRSEDNSDAQFKKPKHETSTASSVKVQGPKVKLGERITALQQIVSPFGKTDTASVLQEAIGYIKFLQEQVQLLSNPFMKSNANKDPWGMLERKDKADAKLDLKSRGLCLVPISCTPQVYRENTGSDYWTPTYRGCLYR